MNAADIMTTDLAALHPDDRITDAIRLMLERHVSGIPVVAGDGTLLGIVTEGDLLRRAETGTETARPRWLEFLMGPGRLAEGYVRTHTRAVADIMTRDVVSVGTDAPLAEVVGLMERHGIKRVPVVRDGVCVGIVSRADLVRALGRMLAPPAGARPGDAAIREHILAEVGRMPWAARRGLTIGVENGVAQLDGVIFDERERHALRVAAENTPGVRRVRDRLTWMEPTSGMIVSAVDDEEAGKPAA